MGIWATLITEDNQELNFASKAVFTFCFDALLWYCRRGELNRDQRETSREILEWFSPIITAMTQPLCILSQATIEPWKYAADQYPLYLAEYVQELGAPPMSEPEFKKTYHRLKNETPWVETDTMLRVVDDLISVLRQLQPRDVWWYTRQDSLPAFEELSQVLVEAKRKEIKKVRFGYG